MGDPSLGSVAGLWIVVIFSSGMPLLRRLARNASDTTTMRAAERYAADSRRCAIDKTARDLTRAVAKAASATMSCSHNTHGIRLAREIMIAADNAGSDGDTTTITSEAYLEVAQLPGSQGVQSSPPGASVSSLCPFARAPEGG